MQRLQWDKDILFLIFKVILIFCWFFFSFLSSEKLQFLQKNTSSYSIRTDCEELGGEHRNRQKIMDYFNIKQNYYTGNFAQCLQEIETVSYTHLDVYKRQPLRWILPKEFLNL